MAPAPICLATIPQKLEVVRANLGKFQFASLKEAEVAFASQDPMARNTAVVDRLVDLREELAGAIDTMRELALWIRMSVPQAEDGNNFGVDVQLMVLKQISEELKEAQTSFDTLAGYASSRADLVDKVSGKASRNTTKTTTQNNSTGGKDGSTSTSSTSEATTDTKSEPSVGADHRAAIAALDTQWYFNLRGLTSKLVGQYCVLQDVIEKNRTKVDAPRGNDHGGHHNMY